MTYAHHRSRFLYALFIAITVALGLLSRSSLVSLPEFLTTYAGDTLWALMVFWIFCVLFHGQSTRAIASYTIVFCFMIEISQLYHEPWIDELRHTGMIGLIIGYVFKFSDLICYSTGVLIGMVIDHFISRRQFEN
ncbi:MAG: DUF2809 domain-containing protein [Zetaproteobacteria bacterium CG02_land_8_20_14_3_00_50_9]|nr:MAG: hypothetical protein AUJ56_00950 [Zetaproteobacteria bacterium CG1_02_49_23]PIQ32940.1 MAG: hypothetical protein COW62_06575 [Zetaproteobacteria bacterium CG17_big_fil_post_rev_8_21_14_2_50_50_13]PIV30763.1 MAG: DUF2809 domain-containing protein [Zetaproteobacteria bacterium CG02_land_8_20_14_3_00_50_9]PIY56557.1 MAG: DUF2809 domain-containing protein [Zetaproteobacteria bacterium CG_4_10_14_0_8_um_filter_49_80]